MTIGFVFPGQGSQFVGMLGDVATAHPSVRQRFVEAGDAIGVDLWNLAQQGPADELAATAIAQPVLLTASYALWEVWRRHRGARPRALAGHSLGEYSALVCGEALAFDDAVRLVHLRGQLMQQAVPRGEGAMAAVLGLEDAVVQACCDEVDGIVSPANYNAPGQVVVAGQSAAVERAGLRCKAAGARRVVPLEVSGPFHCELMAPAREKFAEALSAVAISLPQIDIVHNVDAAPAATIGEIRKNLLQQLTAPVLWSQCVRKLGSYGLEQLIECGPGKVLCGLARRIDRRWRTAAIGDLEGLNAALEAGN